MRLILCFLLMVLLTLSSITTRADSNTSEGNQSGAQQDSNATATGSIETDLDVSGDADTASAGNSTADVGSQGKDRDASKRKRRGPRIQRRAFRPPSPPSGHTDPSPFK